METPNLEELRFSENLQNVQAGGTFNAFDMGSRIRHVQLQSWWERALAVFSVACIAVFVVSFVLRHI